jgi:GMP synthase (glutamine-hydrolysing)
MLLILLVDNGSIYTKNLIDILDSENIGFEKQTPELVNLKELEKYKFFILSGRKQNKKTTNKINSKIILHVIQENKKLLGICYGAEILNLTLGVTIRKLNSPRMGFEKIEIQKKNPLFDCDLVAFESHRFEISKLPSIFSTLGNSKTSNHEIIQYKNKFIFGTQFHPEMSKDGENFIKNFCKL